MTLAELYRHHAPALHRFALRLCGEPAAAEDLVAEAFALAVAGRGPLEPPSARAFVFGAVRNLALHRRRDTARRPAASAAQTEAALAGLAAAGDPERDAASRAELRATLQDLQTLAEEARAALLLRAEGLSHDEIAGVLGARRHPGGGGGAGRGAGRLDRLRAAGAWVGRARALSWIGLGRRCCRSRVAPLSHAAPGAAPRP